MRFIIRHLFFLFLLFFSGLGYFITCTEAGLRSSIYVITSLSSSPLKIQHISGTFFSDFKLHNISYRNAEHDIQIELLAISWNPAGLLQDKFIIKKITLNNARVILPRFPKKTSALSYNLNALILNELVVNKLSLQTDDAHAEISGTFAKQWNATWKMQIPHMNRFIPETTGSIISSGNISGPAFGPTTDALFQSKDLTFKNYHFHKIKGHIHLNGQPKEESYVTLNANNIKINSYALPHFNTEIRGKLTLEDKTLLTNLKMKIEKEHTISAQFKFPKFTHFLDLNQPLIGNIHFNSSRLFELVAGFIPNIQKTQGTLQASLNITGSPIKPLITGIAELSNGKIFIPHLGLLLEKIHVNAHYDPNQPITYSGTLYAGKGLAKLQGVFDITQTDFPVSLTLDGTQLQIINLSEYKVTASPQLQLRYINQHLHIQGKIDIPQAEIKPKNRDNILTMPNEVIFVNKIKKDVLFPLDMTMQLHLHLDKSIHILYKELQTNLSGNIDITKNLNAPITAIGELYAIKGTYHAYGQVLTIQEGRLIFIGGSVTNPGLNIRAAKQIKTVLVSESSNFNKNLDNTFKPMYAGKELITVGVQIDGTFNKPAISLFSTPSNINQSDILSYLIFGYPQSQVSDNQNRMLLSAASALSSGSKSKLNSLTHGIQDKLGLNELNLESTETFNPTTGAVDSTTSVVIGKQLSPNLYAHYSVGLFAPLSILNLRYQLSKRFAIQSETSSMDSGADLLYSIERD